MVVSYYLDSAPTDEATLVFTDSAGNEVSRHSSAIPTEEADRSGLYITANQGMNTFEWPMTWTAGPKMVDTEYHGRPAGPLALPGDYTATLSIGEWSMSQTFSLLKDPRIDVSDTDFEAQFKLQSDIFATLGQIVEGVNTCRGVHKQLDAWIDRLDADVQSDLIDQSRSVQTRLGEIEAQLVQKELTSEGDSLNYREQLFETLTGLRPVVASADSAPTRQSVEVYEKLSGKADALLSELTSVLDDQLSPLEAQLVDAGVGIIAR